MGQRAKLLKEVPVFGGLNEDTIQFILDNAKDYLVKKGQFLFREGEHTASMFILESGKISILKSTNGHNYLLRQMETGDCIGEMALFDFMPRSASAYVMEDSHLIEVSSALLMEVYKFDIEQFALIQMNMGREVTRRLRIADERCFHHRIEASIKDGSIEFFELEGNLGVGTA
ncbi:MAG: cyclic nucleotide-binding domain-containing protein [Pseudomonadales bacterium]|nr:cyclic nucleotide-binding domain-containing protein [Pseudomonadales bacterium]